MRLILFALLAGCAPTAMTITNAHPAHPDAPAGRLAGSPSALEPGVAEPPQPRPAPAEQHHHHAPPEPVVEEPKPESKKPATKPKPKQPAPKPKPKDPAPTPHDHHQGHH